MKIENYFRLSLIIILYNLNLFAQSSLDSVIYQYPNLYNSGKENIIVKGRLTENYPPQLNDIYNEWGQRLIVKFEDELDSADLKKHLQFYGPIGSYKYPIHPARLNLLI